MRARAHAHGLQDAPWVSHARVLLLMRGAGRLWLPCEDLVQRGHVCAMPCLHSQLIWVRASQDAWAFLRLAQILLDRRKVLDKLHTSGKS